MKRVPSVASLSSAGVGSPSGPYPLQVAIPKIVRHDVDNIGPRTRSLPAFSLRATGQQHRCSTDLVEIHGFRTKTGRDDRSMKASEILSWLEG